VASVGGEEDQKCGKMGLKLERGGGAADKSFDQDRQIKAALGSTELGQFLDLRGPSPQMRHSEWVRILKGVRIRGEGEGNGRTGSLLQGKRHD